VKRCKVQLLVAKALFDILKERKEEREVRKKKMKRPLPLSGLFVWAKLEEGNKKENPEKNNLQNLKKEPKTFVVLCVIHIIVLYTILAVVCIVLAVVLCNVCALLCVVHTGVWERGDRRDERR